MKGSAFESRGLWNLVEEDFFAWPLMPQIETQAVSFMVALAQRLRIYNLSAVQQDLLKGLYQELVDPETRRYLGEFYTPDWLAELALREAQFPSKCDGRWPSLLDPACGSGTFLFLAVQLLREAGLSGIPLIQHVFENVVGLDIHPLAVLTAKVNLLLALTPELRSGPLPYRAPLPVYLANSLQVAERRKSGAPITVPLHSRGLPRFPADVPRSFQIPTELPPGGAAAIDELIDRITDLARTGGRPISDLLAGLYSYLEERNWTRFCTWWAGNLRLLHFLVAHNRDTVYRFILRNAFRPTLFSERKFDFVCGNPPWLPYRAIRDPSYKRQVKTLSIELGLLSSSDVKLFTQMEMATLFFMFSYTHYLRSGGTICFVMPRSILTGAKQHANFRNALSGIKRVIDCAEVEPLFNIPSCVIAACRGQKDAWPTTMLSPSGRLSRRNAPLPAAYAELNIRESPLPSLPTEGAKPSTYLPKFIQGATLVPRCFWFVRPFRGSWMTDTERPHLETDPGIQNQAKQPWKGIRLSGAVEAGFLCATLLSSNAVPFGWRRLSLIVLPATISFDQKIWLLDSAEALRKGRTGLASWLTTAESYWSMRSREGQRIRTLRDRLDYQGTLSTQRLSGVYKVLYNTSGTYLASCVIHPQDASRVDGIAVRGLVADSTMYHFETDGEEEAHYICAVLNARHTDEAIKPFQTAGKFGPRHIHRRPFEVLPIPGYDLTDERHLRMAALSQQCHLAVAKAFRNQVLESEGPIGRVRQGVRALLTSELDEIDALTCEILDSAL